MYSHKRLGRQGKRIFFLLRASSFKLQVSSFKLQASSIGYRESQQTAAFLKKNQQGFLLSKNTKMPFQGVKPCFH
jgi:hypothetical protein